MVGLYVAGVTWFQAHGPSLIGTANAYPLKYEVKTGLQSVPDDDDGNMGMAYALDDFHAADFQVGHAANPGHEFQGQGQAIRAGSLPQLAKSAAPLGTTNLFRNG